MQNSHEHVMAYLAEQERLGNAAPEGVIHPDSALAPSTKLRAAEWDAQRGEELIGMIKQAWEMRVGPGVLKDPDELARRLARRRSGMMNRPPRAWCLAVRSADARLDDVVGKMKSSDGERCGNVRADYFRHSVTLDAPLLRRLCTPVMPGGGFWSVGDLMRELGCSLHNIRYMIKHGMVRKEVVPGLDGKIGWPVPVLSVNRPLDPGSRLREHADVVWGTLWRQVVEQIPEDLEQTIERVPSSVVVTPGLRSFGEGEVFTGWKWVCPGCAQTCRTIFYPLPPLNWVQLLKREFHDEDAAHPDALARGNQTFACMRCHNVMYFSRLDMQTWNKLVSHLSAGLMYGREVERPAWYVETRKRPFRPKLNRAPSKRREQIRQMMEQGMTGTEIALKLGLALSTVSTVACAVARQAGMRNAKAFRRKMGVRRDAAKNPSPGLSPEYRGEGQEGEAGFASQDEAAYRE